MYKDVIKQRKSNVDKQNLIFCQSTTMDINEG